MCSKKSQAFICSMHGKPLLRGNRAPFILTGCDKTRRYPGMCWGKGRGRMLFLGRCVLKHSVSHSVLGEEDKAKTGLQEEAFFSGAYLFVSLAMQNNIYLFFGVGTEKQRICRHLCQGGGALQCFVPAVSAHKVVFNIQPGWPMLFFYLKPLLVYILLGHWLVFTLLRKQNWGNTCLCLQEVEQGIEFGTKGLSKKTKHPKHNF